MKVVGGEVARGKYEAKVKGPKSTGFKKMRILVRLQRRNIEDEKSSYERNFLISVRQGKMYSTFRV